MEELWNLQWDKDTRSSVTTAMQRGRINGPDSCAELVLAPRKGCMCAKQGWAKPGMVMEGHGSRGRGRGKETLAWMTGRGGALGIDTWQGVCPWYTYLDRAGEDCQVQTPDKAWCKGRKAWSKP